MIVRTVPSKTVDQIDVAIVGGGLAGLYAAYHLQQSKIKFQLFEAADRLGGRIDAVVDETAGGYQGDLGATWVWPPFQPHVANAITQLGLTTYAQFEQGNAVLDFQHDQPPAHRFLPGQDGMARINGGPQAMIDALVQKLPGENLNLNCPVSEITETYNRLFLHFHDPDKNPVVARYVIIAVPIRLAAESIMWNGLLDDATISVMRNTATWMATQIKVIIRYNNAFWRLKGLSGRVASQVGPMFEIHDHCGQDGQPACLFGFVGWTPEQRRKNTLIAAVKDQLVRCFGRDGADFNHLTFKDWADDRNICAKGDLAGPSGHPQIISSQMREGFCTNKLFFAPAETATHSPGLIDGAFESGERAARQVLAAK